MTNNANANDGLTLQCNPGGDFMPHPEGIHPAVLVDVVDLGMVETEYQGQRRLTRKVKLVFETEQRGDDGKCLTASKNFTASLHPKAKLSEFLGKWRGSPLAPGEVLTLPNLIGKSATLVISHQASLSTGRIYASIDAVSKPMKKLAASGTYDPTETRRRYAEWKAKQAVPASNHAAAPRPNPSPAFAPAPTVPPAPAALVTPKPADDEVPF
jgi:hypothetical protein